MELAHIKLETTGQIPRIVEEYLSEKEDMRPFFHYAPNKEGVSARLQAYLEDRPKTELVGRIIKEQSPDRSWTEAQQRNLEALEKNEALTVTAGHQVVLFGGPLYIYHKIAATIRLAKEFGQKKGVPVVPIFWLATEDHDIDEVDHSYLFGQKLELEHDFKGTAGDVPLSNVESLFGKLNERLGETHPLHSVSQSLQEAYHAESTLGSAIRTWMYSLFSNHGLLILDANHTELKKKFAPIIKRELRDSYVSASMKDAVDMLQHRGEKVQAMGRDVNLFYLREGERWRIERKDSGFLTIGAPYHWSIEDILIEVDQHPERFSPNVLMRPLYQEVLLPDIAFVGGPGEISYWLQLKGVFEASDMKMPPVLLRDMWMIWRSRDMSQWKEMGFDLKALFQDANALKKDFALRNAGEELDVREEKTGTLSAFDRLIARTEKVDPSTAQFAQAERQRILKSIETIEKKLVRAEKKKQETSIQRIDRIIDRMLPSGGLAERRDGLFDALSVDANYLQHIVENAAPLHSSLKVWISEA